MLFSHFFVTLLWTISFNLILQWVASEEVFELKVIIYFGSEHMEWCFKQFMWSDQNIDHFGWISKELLPRFTPKLAKVEYMERECTNTATWMPFCGSQIVRTNSLLKCMYGRKNTNTLWVILREFAMCKTSSLCKNEAATQSFAHFFLTYHFLVYLSFLWP